MSTAFCYVTDGRDDAEMRKWSMASLRRFCGDVPVFTCTAKNLYKTPFDGERVIDISSAFGCAFGGVDPAKRCPGNPSFPALVFGKFALPFVRELASFDTVVALDGDIEVVRPEFAGIMDVRLPVDADVGLVESRGSSTWMKPEIGERYPDLWFPKSTFHSAGLVVMRGNWRPRTYQRRLTRMIQVSMDRKFFLPEEYAANMFLSICTLPPEYHVIPEMKEANRGGLSGKDLDDAYALHYGGPRKKAVRERWKHQYETGGAVDVHNLAGVAK
jgi:hypothetical protein